MAKISRTYKLEEKVVEWIDKKSKENDLDKSKVVQRCVKVYAAKESKGEWSDPIMEDPVEEMFDRTR